MWGDGFRAAPVPVQLVTGQWASLAQGAGLRMGVA